MRAQVSDIAQTHICKLIGRLTEEGGRKHERILALLQELWKCVGSWVVRPAKCRMARFRGWK